MPAVEIANAYIALYAKMPGVQQDIERALGSADTGSIGDGLGREAGKGMGAGIGAMAGLVGGAVAALTTAALGAISGFVSEAIEASDATDKFKQTLDFAGLDTGTIDSLTASTRAYADATVYDLGTIQNTTAQLAANGVANYAQLTEAAGNLNAVAGGNADTFSSVAMVLTQTAGAGKLTTENWNQLADAIPGASGMIQTALKDAGAYTGNFRDAMAKGEITAREFNASLMELGMTDVAAEAASSTDTIEGALGNLEASFVGVFADLISSGKPAITGLINSIAEGVTALGGFLSEIDFSSFLDLASDLSPLGLIFQGLQPLLPQIADLFSQMVAAAMPLAEQLSSALVPIITELMSALMPIIQEVLPILTSLLETLAPIVVMVVEAFSPLLQPILDLISPLLDLVGEILPPLMELFGVLVDALLPVLQANLDMLIPIIEGVVSAISGVLEPALGMIKDVLGGLIKFLTGVFTGDWEKAWDGIVEIFSGIWEGLTGIVKGIINGVIDIINGVINSINGLASTVSDATGGAVDFQIGTIPHLAEGGIVRARPGGVPAVVGEGRYDEAVIPLSPSVLAQLGGDGSDSGYVYLLDEDGAIMGRLRKVARGAVNSALGSVSERALSDELGVV